MPSLRAAAAAAAPRHLNRRSLCESTALLERQLSDALRDTELASGSDFRCNAGAELAHGAVDIRCAVRY
eukprot:2465823-Rhodomonas_salina.1